MAPRDFEGLEKRRMRAVRLFEQGESQAAIDRIVHHSVIADFDVSSYRTAQAQRQVAEEKKPAAKRRRAKS